MIIDQINLNHLRVFESVYRHKSMTLAAKDLYITQSGVSQHIKVLEDLLEVRLFDRIKQKLVATNHAHQLFNECSQSLAKIETVLSEIKGIKSEISGPISIGLPIEFGNNYILPHLSNFMIKYNRINCKIVYGYATDLERKLIDGELDFAFLDTINHDRDITLIEIYKEKLELCATSEYLKSFPDLKANNLDSLRQLDFIDYTNDHTILRSWFNHHFEESNFPLNVRAVLMNVQGVAKLIANNLGCGILPEYYLKEMAKTDMDFTVIRKEGQTPMTNTIHLAYVFDRTKSKATEAAIAFLKSCFIATLTNSR